MGYHTIPVTLRLELLTLHAPRVSVEKNGWNHIKWLKSIKGCPILSESSN